MCAQGCHLKSFSVTRRHRRQHSLSYLPRNRLDSSPPLAVRKRKRSRSSSDYTEKTFGEESSQDTSGYESTEHPQDNNSPLGSEAPVGSSYLKNYPCPEPDSSSSDSLDDYHSEANFSEPNTATLIPNASPVGSITETGDPQYVETIPGYLLPQQIALINTPLPSTAPYWVYILYIHPEGYEEVPASYGGSGMDLSNSVELFQNQYSYSCETFDLKSH